MLAAKGALASDVATLMKNISNNTDTWEDYAHVGADDLKICPASDLKFQVAKFKILIIDFNFKARRHFKFYNIKSSHFQILKLKIPAF